MRENQGKEESPSCLMEATQVLCLSQTQLCPIFTTFLEKGPQTDKFQTHGQPPAQHPLASNREARIFPPELLEIPTGKKKEMSDMSRTSTFFPVLFPHHSIYGSFHVLGVFGNSKHSTLGTWLGSQALCLGLCSRPR